MSTLAAITTDSQRVLAVAIFLAFVGLTLVIVSMGRNNKTAADYYAAGRAFTGPQNGIAISGDYLSAASFLGIAGAIAINGLRRLPVLHRLPGGLAGGAAARRRAAAQHRQVHDGRRPVLPAAAAAGPHGGGHHDPGVSLFYLLAQMAGAGGLVALLLGVERQARPEPRRSPSSARS